MIVVSQYTSAMRFFYIIISWLYKEYIAINLGLFKNSKIVINLSLFKFSNHLKNHLNHPRINHLRSNHQTHNYKKKFFSHDVNMSSSSLNELKLIAKSRGIKGYKSMPKERLLSALSKSESVKSKNNFDNARIKKIKEDLNKLRYRFCKSKIKQIRKKTQKIFLNQK